MNVVATLKMDLARPEQIPQVFCVQGDTYSRTVVLELLANGTVWTVPEGTSVLISYYKPDGTCGTYTQLPDGPQAWAIDGNLVTIALTPQMLTAAGLVSAQLKLVRGEDTISTFAFQVMVRPGIAPGDDPENYTAWLTAYLPQASDAAVGEYLQISQVDASGRVTGVTGTEIELPPDHTDRILALEGRTLDLENSTGIIPQLGSRITALERSTGEIPNLKNRIISLESRTENISQLENRVLDLESCTESIPQLESRVLDLESSTQIIPQLESRVLDLESCTEIIPQLESRVLELEASYADLEQMDARIGILESGALPYPAEWGPALEACIEEIHSRQEYGGNHSVSFAYFSDNHNNGGCAGALISYVLDKCGMPFSFFCGDMVADENLDDIPSVDRQIRSFNAMMAPIPREKDLRALGEHDFCRVDSNGKIWKFEMCHIYDRFFRRQYCRNQCVIGSDPSFFYVDDSYHKIRFIVLNTLCFTPKLMDDFSLESVGEYGFGQEQIDWLIQEALYFQEDDWGVIFIAHSPLSNQGSSNLRDAHIVHGILSAFVENRTYSDSISGVDSVDVEVDFQDAIRAEFIGWFSGHTHTDSITTLELASEPDTYRVPLNVVTIAADGDNGHAIDFVTIDKDLRTVFLTRLGQGENRSFTY